MSTKLNSRQYKAIQSLLIGSTIGQAAAEAGCSEKTVRRWLADPRFTAELNDSRREIVERVATRLVALADQAVAALAQVMKNPSAEGAGTRRMAAATTLELCHKWLQLVTFEDRLAALEAIVNEHRKTFE